MLDKKFDKPTSLNPKVNISDDMIRSSSTVKSFLQEEIPQRALGPNEEIKTKHFYIKQIAPAVSETSDLPLYLPEYYVKRYIPNVYYAQKELTHEGEKPSIDELVKYFETKTNDLELKEGESIKSKIEKAIDMMRPETILRYHKQLYDRHRDWYNKKIPGFIINKLFVVGEDDDHNKHGYIIKSHVDAAGERSGFPGLHLADILIEARSLEWSVDIEDASEAFIHNAQKYLSLEQRNTLAKEIKNFITITNKVIRNEGLVIDFGGHHDARGPNIWISADGHLRMIDTDRVYPAKRGDGRYDTPAQQTFLILRALRYVADYLNEAVA